MALKTISLSLILTLILIFYITITTTTTTTPLRRSLLNKITPSCPIQSNVGILNYHCIFPQTPFLSIPSLSVLLILHFYILINTASHHFSIVTTKLASHLNLSPSMAAVTLLALGNGSPDVFSSLAALRAGQYRTGFGAILSAGAFVSALVVGFVAIYSAPFPVDPAPFVRDVLFYLTSAMFLFYVYLSAEIFLWQAVGFVAFYLFFVAFVFYMDLGMSNRREKTSADLEGQIDSFYDEKASGSVEKDKHASGFRGSFRLVCFKLSISFVMVLAFHIRVLS